MNDLPKRKPNRLKGYDYSSSGVYFITICTDNRKCILSEIVGQGLAPAEVKLTLIGKIALKELLGLEERFNCLKINEYVIMPNHIHILFTINNIAAGASPCPTVSDIICAFKSLTSRNCKKLLHCADKIWQNSFYDHIIRDEEDYNNKAEYIVNNPLKWNEDELYCNWIR